jgi:hypothetical protein
LYGKGRHLSAITVSDQQDRDLGKLNTSVMAFMAASRRGDICSRPISLETGSDLAVQLVAEFLSLSLSLSAEFGYTMERKPSKQSGYRPRESISETLEHKSGSLATKPHHLLLTEVVYMEFNVLFNCFNWLANYGVIPTYIVYLKLLLHQEYL